MWRARPLRLYLRRNLSIFETFFKTQWINEMFFFFYHLQMVSVESFLCQGTEYWIPQSCGFMLTLGRLVLFSPWNQIVSASYVCVRSRCVRTWAEKCCWTDVSVSDTVAVTDVLQLLLAKKKKKPKNLVIFLLVLLIAFLLIRWIRTLAWITNNWFGSNMCFFFLSFFRCWATRLFL